MVLTLSELKQRFQSGDRPSQSDFGDLIDTMAAIAQLAQIEGFTVPEGSLDPGDFADGPPNYVFLTDSSGVPQWGPAPPASGAVGGCLTGTLPNPSAANNAYSVACLLTSEAIAAGIGSVIYYNGTQILWGPLPNIMVSIQDVRASGTQGGAATAGIWTQRVINTLQNSVSGTSVLSGNTFTLPAGSWYARVSCPANGVSHHQARLFNITDNSVTLVGTSEIASGVSAVTTRSVISGIFTLASSKTFRVEHKTSASNGSSGLGTAANLGVNEVYLEGEFRKVG